MRNPTNGDALKYVDEKFKADKEVVLEAVRSDARILYYADESLKKDKKIILTALKKNGNSLNYADESLKKDKEIVLTAIKQNGGALEYADKKFQDDKKIVLAAIKSKHYYYGGAQQFIQYAGDKIRSDKAFMEKHITEKEIFEKYFISKENLKKYIYSVYIRGSGGERKAGAISKKIYDFFILLGGAQWAPEGPWGPNKNYREEERACATTSAKFNYFSWSHPFGD